MKIIHCADVHLDSPMARLGDAEKKKTRRAELLKAFLDLVDYAKNEGISAVIIAGDLFDESKVSATAKNAVLGAMTKNPEIDFYYVKGNHDKTDFLTVADEIPENLHTFGEGWQTYDLGENVSLTGVELTAENSARIYSTLNLDPGRFNIVTLHGQESSAKARDNAQVVSVKDLKNKGIDYLALGHVHAYKSEKLDGRGTYCYPGCLESRGFDEVDEHGFVVLDIDTEKNAYAAEKICRPIRSAHVIQVDVSDCENSVEILNETEKRLAEENFPETDMVKVELTGEIDFSCEKDDSFIEKQLEGRFFDFKLKDLTRFKVDYEKFKLDESLKGEFVRLASEEPGLTAEEKAEIIRIGIRALMGEEVE